MSHSPSEQGRPDDPHSASSLRHAEPAFRAARLAPLLVCFLVALLAWLIFYPGLLSTDSINQYRQAVEGSYTDHHPPVMAVILSALMACGGDIGLLMLLQSLAASFGLYHFALACLRFIRPKLEFGRSRWLALAIYLLLMWPLTPFVYYMVTFWKDAWLVILFLWIGACSVNLFSRAAVQGRRRFHASLALLLVLMTFSILVRHNALVILPAYSAAVFLILYRRMGKAAAPVLLAPAVLYVAANWALYRLFDVRRVHPGDQIMALDLVGLCVADDSLRSSLPHTNRHLVEDRFRRDYRYGDLAPLCYAPNGLIVKPGYVWGNQEALVREYWRAVRQYPWAVAKVKFRAFHQLLREGYRCGWFLASMKSNSFGLRFNRRFRAVRSWMWRISNEQVCGTPLRWFSGSHVVWMALNGIWIVVSLLAYARNRESRLIFAAVMLFVPLCYYFSYLLATSCHDFRFMYPSTVAVQVVSASWIAGVLTPAAWRAGTIRRFAPPRGHPARASKASSGPSIGQVVERGLCCGCGVCAGICPEGAIKMKANASGEYVPVLEGNCRECGECLRVCPFGAGPARPRPMPRDDTHGDMGYRSLLGDYSALYIGHALEGEWRSRGASGGLVSWLCVRLLQEGLVDAAVCVASDGGNNAMFSPCVARQVSAVQACAGSKYYPVEYSEVVGHMLSTPGRYAVVALPCVARGLRRLCARNKALGERIAFILGLTCGHGVSAHFTRLLLAARGLAPRDVERVDYRFMPEPEESTASDYAFRAKRRSGTWSEPLPIRGLFGWAWLRRLFVPTACDACDDLFAECADATFMDAWLPEAISDPRGTSIAVVRNEVITTIMRRAVREGEGALKGISAADVCRSQQGAIDFKRRLAPRSGQSRLQTLLRRLARAYLGPERIKWKLIATLVTTARLTAPVRQRLRLRRVGRLIRRGGRR